jgi:basic membrane protein A
VIDKSWKPIFKRWGIPEGGMAIAPYGPKVPQKVKDAVSRASADLAAGNTVVFKGPIKDQKGKVKVAQGAVLTDDVMGSVDWFVEGVIGRPK